MEDVGSLTLRKCLRVDSESTCGMLIQKMIMTAVVEGHRSSWEAKRASDSVCRFGSPQRSLFQERNPKEITVAKIKVVLFICVHMYTASKRIELESPGWSGFEASQFWFFFLQFSFKKISRKTIYQAGSYHLLCQDLLHDSLFLVYCKEYKKDQNTRILC